jgi:hypothetical protein
MQTMNPTSETEQLILWAAQLTNFEGTHKMELSDPGSDPWSDADLADATRAFIDRID